MANKLKMIRENETVHMHSESVLSCDNKPLEEIRDVVKNSCNFNKEELSEVIYAIIRKLNYMYDLAGKNEREAILDKKARLMLELLYLEEIVDKLNYPNSRSRVKTGSAATPLVLEEK